MRLLRTLLFTRNSRFFAANVIGSAAFMALTAGPYATAQSAASALYVVTTVSDANNAKPSNCTNQALPQASLDRACSLRDALGAAATVSSAGGSIPVNVTFASSLASSGSPAKIVLTGNSLALPNLVTLQGLTSGQGYTLKNLITLDGSRTRPLLYASAGTTAAVKNLILANGSAGTGGALSNYGVLTVDGCTFQNNTATVYGGAIYTEGDLTVTSSTFTGNTAGRAGGALYDTNSAPDAYGSRPSNVSVSSSTFTANSSVEGGAIYNGLGGQLMASFSTFTANVASVDGAAVYSTNASGTPSVTNSILTGDSGGSECGGVGCDDATIAFRITGTGISGESGTMALILKTPSGTVYNVPVPFGPFSTGDSIASYLGGYISGHFFGAISAQGIGPIVVIKEASGAPLQVTLNNPSTTLRLSQVPTKVLVGSANVVGVSSTAANLTPLGDHGGPVATVLPLPGSAALCAMEPGVTTGTDARGLPRWTQYGSSTCSDAGAVQTNYSLSFVQQPSTSFVGKAMTPPPSVQLAESGTNVTEPGAPLSLYVKQGTLTIQSSLSKSTGGLFTFPNLSINAAQKAYTLVASTPAGRFQVTATSSPFDVNAADAATLVGNTSFPSTVVGAASTAQNFVLTNTGGNTLVISGVSVSGDFAQSTNCGTTLAPGSSCAVSVVFRPTATGVRSGTLSIVNSVVSPLTLTGTGLPQPGFTIQDSATGSNTSAVTTAAGTTASVALKLTSQNGFTGPVALTCAAKGSAPAATTCTVTGSVTLSSSGTANATVTFTTLARPSGAGILPPSRSGWMLGLFACVAGLFALQHAASKRLPGSLMAFAMLSILGLTGCTTKAIVTNTGTPAGTYTYIVSGAGYGATATQSVVLTVR